MKDSRVLESFALNIPIQTRWMDNDMYGHVNNVVYYSYFDTLINKILIEQCNFDLAGPVIGVIVNSNCNYFNSISFPEELVGAFRVNKLGNSSVEYGVAIFKQGQKESSASATMTHVFVSKDNNTPVSIPSYLRQKLQQFAV